MTADRNTAPEHNLPAAEGFVADSPLEERVSSEPVSEAQFPGNWEKYRDFYRRGLRIRLSARNPEPNSIIYDPIPYASEQGIYFCLAGN